MHRKILVLLVAVLVALIACGDSKKPIQAKKHHLKKVAKKVAPTISNPKTLKKEGETKPLKDDDDDDDVDDDMKDDKNIDPTEKQNDDPDQENDDDDDSDQPEKDEKEKKTISKAKPGDKPSKKVATKSREKKDKAKPKQNKVTLSGLLDSSIDNLAKAGKAIQKILDATVKNTPAPPKSCGVYCPAICAPQCTPACCQSPPSEPAPPSTYQIPVHNQQSPYHAAYPSYTTPVEYPQGTYPQPVQYNAPQTASYSQCPAQCAATPPQTPCPSTCESACCPNSQPISSPYLMLAPAPKAPKPKKAAAPPKTSYASQCQAPCPQACAQVGCTQTCCNAALQQQWQMVQPQVMAYQQQPMAMPGCSPQCAMASVSMGCRRQCPAYCCNKDN